MKQLDVQEKGEILEKMLWPLLQYYFATKYSVTDYAKPEKGNSG